MRTLPTTSPAFLLSVLGYHLARGRRRRQVGLRTLIRVWSIFSTKRTALSDQPRSAARGLELSIRSVEFSYCAYSNDPPCLPNRYRVGAAAIPRAWTKEPHNNHMLVSWPGQTTAASLYTRHHPYSAAL